MSANGTSFQVVIHKALAANELMRDVIWTDNVAVGSKAFTENLAPIIRNRNEVVPKQAVSKTAPHNSPDKLWVIREPQTAYR